MPTLQGVLPALVTPLDADARLDRAGLDRLLDHVLAVPIAGVSPAGSTGEGPLLAAPLRLELTRTVAGRLSPDQWLLPGVPAPTAGEALAEIEALAGAGASAALLPPPWYYPLDPGELVGYFTGVADAAAVPLVLYDIPRFTKVSLPPGTVAELAAHPRIIGIKDSSGDFEHLARTVWATADQPGFSVLTGTDSTLLAALVSGAAGTIAASVNIVPGTVQGVYDAVRAGRLDEAGARQRRVAAIATACSAARFPSGWKAALEVLGICGRWPAPPLAATDAGRLDTLAAELDRLGVRRSGPAGDRAAVRDIRD